MKTEERIIKKYPNRRLYDTTLSRYITLTEVRGLVIELVDFKVVDANSGNDITRSILLQIIMEQENGGEPLFTAEILSRMIRYYGNAMQNSFTAYLGNSIDLFAEQQKQVQDQLQDAINLNPMEAMTEMMHKNLDLWRDMQEKFMNKQAREKDDEDR